jgi:hypothetical protein
MADDGVLTLRTTVDLSGLTQYNSAAAGVAASTEKMGDSFTELEGKVEKSQHSMMEARHGVMLLGEEFGVHMPRAVSTLLASIGPIGAAMEVAFPILGALALVEVIGKAIEKHEAYAAELRKNAAEEANLEIKERDRAEQLEATNLKLDDQIGKIEGRPAQNKLAIALLDAKVRADELAASLATVLEKGDEALAGEQTAWASFGDTIRVVWEDLKDGTPLANNAAVMKKSQSAVEELRTAMQNVQYARERMSEPSANEAERKAAVADYTHELQNLKEKADTAVAVLSGSPGDWSKSLHAAREASIEATSGLEQMAEQAKNLNSSLALPGIENIAKIHELLTKAVGGPGLQGPWSPEVLANMRAVTVQGSELGRVLDEIGKQADETGKVFGEQLKRQLEDTIKLDDSAIKMGQSYQKLYEAQMKTTTAGQVLGISAQEAEIKRLADTQVITEQQKAARLRALYLEERDQQVQAITEQLAVVQVKVEQAATGLIEAQQTGDQRLVNEAQTALNQQLTAREEYEAKMIEKYQQFATKLSAIQDQNDKQMLASINSFVTSAVSSLNSFAVTITTTIGEVNGKVSETRYIGEQFSKLWIQIEREFLQMVLKMLEDTTLFKGIEHTVQGAFSKAFSIIPGLGPATPPVQPAGIPGLAGGIPLVGGQIAGGAGGAQQSAANAALTEFTSSLHLASTALAQSHAATTADTSATQLNTGATHTDIAATQISTGATHTDTAATVVSTSSTATNTAAVTTSTAAHTFHTPTVLADAGGFITHEAAVIGDTIAMIAHKIAALFTGAQTGGLIQGPGTGTSDSIHMMVSSGEYIVRAAAVAQPGMLDTLHALNSGKVSGGKLTGHHAATGGYMDAAEYDNRVGSAFGDTGSFGGDHGGGGGGGSTQFNSEPHFHLHQGNVSALDGEGLGSVLRRGDKHIASIARTAIARGQIDVRQLLRGR